MSNPGVIPSISQIPDPTADAGMLLNTARALKHAVDVLAGFRGDPLGRAVTFNDLIRLGLTTPIAVTSPAGTIQAVAPALFTPVDPAATAATVMMGLGSVCVAAPGPTGCLAIVITGDCSVDTNGAQGSVQLYMGDYASGAPNYGAGVTGAALGEPAVVTMAAANQKVGFAIAVAVSALNPIQQQWLDLALTPSAGNVLVENLNIVVLAF